MFDLTKVYLLYYVHEFEDGHDKIELIGVFSTKDKAMQAIQKDPFLKKIEKKLIINKDIISELGWTDGFITV